VEIDPVAVESARANVTLNHLDDIIRVEQGSVPLLDAAQYDIVIANIIARVIAELAQPLADAMRPDGLLIVSGIIAEREQMVLDGLTQAGLTLVQRNVDGDWLALTWKKGRSLV
jgi:ribosomal protein L11 methyltransferase